jgi:restriction system protein
MWNDDPLEISPEEFEREIESMLRTAGPQMDGFQVVRRKKIMGCDGEYEIDVLVTFRALGGVEFRVLVECKRHTHPIKRDLVQVLHQRKESIGAQKGILFSTADFQEGAIAFAKAHGIALGLVKGGETTWFTRSETPLRERPDWADPSPLAVWILQSGETGTSLTPATSANPGALRELIGSWVSVPPTVAPSLLPPPLVERPPREELLGEGNHDSRSHSRQAD